MIHKPIYTPKGCANEYCELALNIYKGCNHGCTYCFARGMAKRFTPKGSVCNFDNPVPKKDIVESVKRQIEREQMTGKLIHLCFNCDPYPSEIDTTPTREIIKIIKQSGNHVQILTKGGRRAERDFDLLDKNDWFGVTFTGLFTAEDNKKFEPYSAGFYYRLDTIEKAHLKGIKTWVSLEPVMVPANVKLVLESNRNIDLFRIGKLNLDRNNSTPELEAIHDSINWHDFGHGCERLCLAHGRNYYIKEDLRKEMQHVI
ncbi:MAG: DUF5131 family protein [Oscillospiraceae bacterium]|nr:DUF5131 family protein [Oscillospiraceae bacterium]